MNSKFTRLSFFLSFFIVFGCEDFFECNIARDPELPEISLPIGHIGDYYYKVIRAEISNEPSDNDYDYYFTISEDFPSGLEVSVSHRDVIIEGYPNINGEFNLSVHLEVEYSHTISYDECDPLSSHSITRDYPLTIFQ